MREVPVDAHGESPGGGTCLVSFDGYQATAMGESF